MTELLRGALPSPRHRLAAAAPHTVDTVTPPMLLWKPARLSMWANNVYGLCTVAEEAFAKGAIGGIFVPDEIVIAWARSNGAINGDTLIDVLTKMQTGGFLVDDVLYTDGSPTSVDWTNPAVLQNAIAQGPVKIGIAADQLEAVVADPPTNGWFANGFHRDQALDHCVALCGYGPIEWLAGELETNLPVGVDCTASAYALFTWGTIGIITQDSMVAITGEAWLRNPTTVTNP